MMQGAGQQKAMGGVMELTKNQKIMKYAGLLYGLTFIFTAVVFFLLLPDTLMKAVNWISAEFFPSLPAYPLGENKFWLTMTVSMMTGVTVTSLLIFKDVSKNYIMALPLCAMKFTSSLLGLGFFIAGFIAGVKEWTALANLVIFITDFPLGLFMLVMYKRVKAEM